MMLSIDKYHTVVLQPHHFIVTIYDGRGLRADGTTPLLYFLLSKIASLSYKTYAYILIRKKRIIRIESKSNKIGAKYKIRTAYNQQDSLQYFDRYPLFYSR